MYSQTFNVGAYKPVMSDEQSGKAENALSVVDGENFAWKVGAVYSAYGHDVRTDPLPDPMRHPFIAKIGDETYYFCASGVYAWDGTWQLVFGYAETYVHDKWDLTLYKWTQAFVGTRHWFCHPRIGLVYYDMFDGEWGIFRDDCWTGPTYAVTQADLRLVILLEDTAIWSKIDEGHIFDCDWQCGTGAQSLAKIHYGQPYTVMPYQNGWLTFTSTGVMVSVPEMQQVQDPDGQRIAVGPLVYRHSIATLEHLLIGTCAVTHIDERQVIWLTKKGFYQFAATQGGGFGAAQPWQPILGLFYQDVLISEAAGCLEDHFCIENTCDQGWLFVSSRSSAFAPDYDRAHVYQVELDRWGSFNHNHLFVGYARQHDSTLLEDVHLAFINTAGRACFVDHRPRSGAWVRFSPQRLQLPQDPSAPATLLTAVQEIRVGCSQPAWSNPAPLGLRSSWLQDRKNHIEPSHFDLMISSGFDSETQNVDEAEYATVLHRAENTAVFKCHATGIAHNITAAADRADSFFQIDHVEITYFIAGVL